ncbi:hypothetical protein TWF730_005605 [Orbilia blumenaviensis]|uniref:DUF7770 domain-containing protein n=1 Tax=Orbilia blumenaviensis TaxID=1796055 RepID=A0AAV9VL46_9PEZI
MSESRLARVPENSRVATLRVIAHSTRVRNSAEPGRYLNHWVIYLHTERGQVVRINMRMKNSTEWPYELIPGVDYGVPGFLEITAYERFAVTPTMVKSWDAPMLGRPRVKDFINNLVSNKRQLYTMSKCGAGCRYWIYTVMSDFAEAMFIGEQSVPFMHERLMRWYEGTIDNVTQGPLRTMPQGRFWEHNDWDREMRRYDPRLPNSDMRSYWVDPDSD